MNRALVVIVMAFATPAMASRALEVPLEALTRKAQLVVDGDAGEPVSFWLDGRIFTRTPIRVRSSYKGTAHDSTLSVVTRGGVVDGVGQRVDGEANLAPADHAVLFLVYDERFEAYRIVAMNQGAFSIADKQGARLKVADLPVFAKKVRELARAR